MAKRKGKRDAGTASIIIRREEIIEDAHHGGAWKVAYADFVTAMMAFFLLMWLINAITDDQRRGIAAYFNPLADREHSVGGSGMLPVQPTPFSDNTAIAERLDPSKPPATPSTARTPTQAVINGGTPASASIAPGPTGSAALGQGGGGEGDGGQADASDGGASGRAAGDDGSGAGARRDPDTGGEKVIRAVVVSGPAMTLAGAGGRNVAATAITAKTGVDTATDHGADATARAATAHAADALRAALRDDPDLADSSGQVDVQVVPQGLQVQITDAAHKPMFDTGRSVPNPRAVALLRRIAPFLAQLGGPVSITGHTDAVPYPAIKVADDGAVSNWTLSSARAAAAEQVLAAGGLPETAISDVTGRADRDPLLPADPTAAANRRIVLLVRARPAGRPDDARPASAPPHPSDDPSPARNTTNAVVQPATVTATISPAHQ